VVEHRSSVTRKGSVVEHRSSELGKKNVEEHQLGLEVDLFLLNCWIAGCQVVLSKRLSSQLMLLD
jgi:hypothetical protein